MPRGGARVNSGPPPDPNALRRNRPEDKAGWKMLPAEGRLGDPPAWPLAADLRLSTMLEAAESAAEVLAAQIDGGQAPRHAAGKLAKLDQDIALLKAKLAEAAGAELALWASVWSTPQAAAWEELRWVREVALYVRWQVQAEFGDMEAAKEARQWSDRLGLNPAAMLRNRWKVKPAEEIAEQAGRPARAKARPSARDRLRVVGA